MEESLAFPAVMIWLQGGFYFKKGADIKPGQFIFASFPNPVFNNGHNTLFYKSYSRGLLPC